MGGYNDIYDDDDNRRGGISPSERAREGLMILMGIPTGMPSV